MYPSTVAKQKKDPEWSHGHLKLNVRAIRLGTNGKENQIGEPNSGLKGSLRIMGVNQQIPLYSLLGTRQIRSKEGAK
jgi:hypothetical protein